jgi:hypothetical protein
MKVAEEHCWEMTQAELPISFQCVEFRISNWSPSVYEYSSPYVYSVSKDFEEG